MASSVLIVNWVFLGERSESGAAGATVRNDNTRLNQHLCHPRASSTAGQVFLIFVLFLPASLLLVHWDECLCWQISLHPYVTAEVPGGEDAHHCYAYVQPNPTEESVCSVSSLSLDIYASLLGAQVWQKLWYLKVVYQNSNKHSLMQQSARLSWSLSSQAL